MKIIDMSQPLFHNCPAWPTYEMTRFNYETVVGNDGFTSERMDMNSHTGTHLDAPFHFFPGLETIDQMPIDKFIGKAHILNFKGIPPASGIGKEQLAPYLDAIQPDDIVLLYTGWDVKRNVSNEYYHDWPYLTGEGAEALLARKVKGVGIDGLSMGGWYEGCGRPCHEALLSNGVWLLEEVRFPEELLKYKTCQLYAVPLLLKGFGGSPTRAFAIVD
jgi:kynurenine formamidase